MRVKCLAQEHNTLPQPVLEPGLSDPESCTLTIRPLRLTHDGKVRFNIVECTMASLY